MTGETPFPARYRGDDREKNGGERQIDQSVTVVVVVTFDVQQHVEKRVNVVFKTIS